MTGLTPSASIAGRNRTVKSPKSRALRHPAWTGLAETMGACAMNTPMNVTLRKPWTQDQFFIWAHSQEERYEFDGFQPVSMTGGNINHGLIMRSLHRALDTRLRGSCQALGPDVGVATAGNAVRYPDALVTCDKLIGKDQIVPGVIVAFEILSPTSGRTDRIIKVREYAAVSSIRRYVILESSGIGLQVFERQVASEAWRATTLTGDDVLRMPEISIEIPVAEFYDRVDFNGAHDSDVQPQPRR
jgi:Uma2 family endonuclease